MNDPIETFQEPLPIWVYITPILDAPVTDDIAKNKNTIQQTISVDAYMSHAILPENFYKVISTIF